MAGAKPKASPRRARRAYGEIAAALARSLPAGAGFYLPGPGGGELVLGPRRDRPACSPIGLHGVCGRALRERRPVVVADVRTPGASYVACDPADRSELAVPLVGEDGEPLTLLSASP